MVYRKKLNYYQKNSFTAEVVNAFIVYELDTWPNDPLDNFTLKNCLFGASNIAKNSDKDKWFYCSNGIAFDGKSLWSFSNLEFQ